MLMIIIPSAGKVYGVNTRNREKPITGQHDFVYKWHGGDWHKFSAFLQSLRDKSVKDSPEHRRLNAAIHEAEKRREQ